MPTPLRVLIVEDRPEDADLLVLELGRAGFAPDWRRVETEREFLAHLDPRLDLILADYRLPRFGAPRALALLRTRGLEVPCIVVSGTISEEMAVESLTHGAVDYVLKDRLVRLGPAVKRALRERGLRRAHRAAETARRESEARYRLIAETVHDAIFLVDLDGQVLFANARAETLSGYAAADLVGKPVYDLYALESGRDVQARLAALQAGATVPPLFEGELIRQDGSRVWVESNVADVVREGKLVARLAVFRDVTERKAAEQRLRDLASEATRRAQRLTALSALTRLITSVQEPGRVCDAIARAAAELVDAAVACVWGDDPETRTLRLVGGFGIDPDTARTLREYPRIPYGSGVTGWIFASKRPEYLTEAHDDARWLNPRFTRALDLHGYAGLPLLVGDQAHGVLAVFFREARTLAPEERELMGLLADQAAIALRNARLFREVEERRDLLQAIASASADAIATTDLRGRLTYVSPGGEAMLGHRAPEVLGRPVADCYPGGRDEARAIMARLRAEGQIRNHPMAVRAADGRWLQLSTSISLLHGAAGEVVGTLAVAKDVTPLKEAEAERRLTEAHLAGVLDLAADAIISVDEAQRIVVFNKSAERLFGYAAEEVLGQPLDQLLPSRFAAGHREHVRAFAAAPVAARLMGDRREVAARRKDGSEFPAEASIAKLTHAGRTTFTAILRDISERKRAETALRESERRLATLLANLSGMAYRCRNDPHWTMEYASEGCLALTGYPAADLVGNARVVFGDLIHPDDRQPLWEACQASLTARGACSQEYRIRAATGDEKWVWDQARGVYAESGELLAIEGFITDVTARKEAEAQLLAKTEQLHAMAEAAVSFLETGDWRGASACLLRGALRQTASEYGFAGVVVDDTLRILAHEGVAWDAGVNRDFYEAARRRYEEVGYLEFPSLENLFGCVVTTGRAVLSNDPAADPRSGGRLSPGHPPLRCFLGVPMLKGTAVVGMLGVANRPGGYTAADQAQLEVLAHMASVLYDNYRRSLRERSLQEELRQAQKMDAIGRLAGGIAHDFNNLLTVILGRSQVALRRLSPDDPLRRSIALIAETAERAGALVQQLLAFSRKQLTQPRVLVLTEVVTRLEQMLRRLIGEDVELVTTFAPDLGRVKADPSQLEQVLVNLAVNARDAMPTGGRLTIETENVQLDLAFARRHRGARPGPYVRLSVSDTGVGMDAVTRARIFEPFFTTKEPGKGTGLGLATVYGIVKQSDGYIAVDSEPGHGARFDIYLPRVDAPPEPLPAAPALGARGGSETLLLVEDEPALRDMTREILELHGYTVIEAGSGADALDVAARHPGPIHLLLTDVVLPRMGGRQLAERLVAQRPETKVLFMSGYTDDALGRHGALDPGVVLLPKPFAPDALARAVRQALDTPGPGRGSAPPAPVGG